MWEEDDDQINAALQRMASYAPDPRDTALRDRWRGEEERTLSTLEGGDDYGIGQLLRDVLPSAVGIGADLLTNKGQGVGSILDTGMAAAQANLARDAQRTAQNREYALEQRAQRESNQGTQFDRDYKIANTLQDQRRIAIAEGNLGHRGTTVGQNAEKLDLQKDQASFLRNPNDPRAVALKKDLIANGADPGIAGLALGALQERGVVTRQQVEHAYAPIHAQDAANETTATTGARIRTEHNMAPLSADTKGQEAAATQTRGTEARITTEGRLADTSAATAGTQAAGTTAGRLAAEADATEEGYLAPLARAELDPERVKLVARNPKVAAEARQRLEASGELVEILNDMVDIRDKEAQGLAKPGSARSFFDANRVRLEGAIAAGNGMGVLNEGDRASVGSFLGSSQAGWTDLSGLLGGDLKLEQLNGVRQAFLNADRRTARSYGYGEYGTAQSQTTPRTVDQPAAPRPRAPRAPSASPSTAAPAPSAGGGMVTIRLGGQTTQVPRDQAERLKVMNPSLEVL